MTQITEYHEQDILNPRVAMKEKLTIAKAMAEPLREILNSQDFVVNIQGNKYVTAEGWNTVGTVLGTYACTETVEPIDYGKGRIAYKARVSIKQGDLILATAEAIATNAGHQKQEHTVFSMAQTRAMAKAYRMAFSWIIKLAGYEPTPAEEMEEREIHTFKKKEKTPIEWIEYSKQKLNDKNIDISKETILDCLSRKKIPLTVKKEIKKILDDEERLGQADEVMEVSE